MMDKLETLCNTLTLTLTINQITNLTDKSEIHNLRNSALNCVMEIAAESINRLNKGER